MHKDGLTRSSTQAGPVLNVAVDVGLDEVHLFAELDGTTLRRTVRNGTEDLQMMCRWLKGVAQLRGIPRVRVIAEPTGVYHELLFAIARKHGFEARLVQAEAVKKLRVVMFGDYGKTDARDPEVILDLAKRGRLIPDRSLSEVFSALRTAGIIYARAEREAVRAKNRIHRTKRRVFPDFDFSTDFLFSRSGDAVMEATGFDPHRIVHLGLRLTQILRRRAPRMQHRSIERLLAAAALSRDSVAPGPAHDLRLLELRQAWDDLKRAEARKAEAAEHLLALYDQARLLDPDLPAAQPGLASKLSLARLVAETGPWSDFDSVEQLLKYIGLNLYEQQSGRWRGKTTTSKKGRSLARHVLSEIVLPLVRRGRLLGEYHHHKVKIEKKPGSVAITAAARKTLNILWGWGRSRKPFDVNRVFTCESQLAKAA